LSGLLGFFVGFLNLGVNHFYFVVFFRVGFDLWFFKSINVSGITIKVSGLFDAVSFSPIYTQPVS